MGCDERVSRFGVPLAERTWVYVGKYLQSVCQKLLWYDQAWIKSYVDTYYPDCLFS